MKNSTKNSIFSTLENDFAAAALTEGNLDMARDFMKTRATSSVAEATDPTVSTVRSFVNGFERHFAAAAMAEGNVEMAREILHEVKSSRQSVVAVKIKGFVKAFEGIFAAAAMAEGGQEMAREYMQYEVAKKRPVSLKTFMQTIGLDHVRFQYRVAVI